MLLPPFFERPLLTIFQSWSTCRDLYRMCLDAGPISSISSMIFVPVWKTY